MTTPQIAADALIKEMGNSPDEITRTQASGFRQVHEAGINRRRGEPFFVLLVRVLRQALSLQSEIPMSYAAEGRFDLVHIESNPVMESDLVSASAEPLAQPSTSTQITPTIILAPVRDHPKISGRRFGPVSPDMKLAEITTLRLRKERVKITPRYFVKKTRTVGHCIGCPFWEWVAPDQTLASLDCFEGSRDVYLVYTVEGMGDRFIIGLHKTNQNVEKALTIELNGKPVREEVNKRLGRTRDYIIKRFDQGYMVGHLRLKEEHFQSRTTALYVESE
ncbi:hypothetical protein FRC19_007790 [Serendipita sp. 401]|nr:hypothetical protein FRC19_007790 [Serendipita sp. 401]